MKTPNVTKALGLPNGLDIEYAITEPALRNLEISMTGHSVGKMRPGAELVEGADHNTYSHKILGDALGAAPELAPVDVAFPDASHYIRQQYRPSDFTGTIQKVYPHQIVDDRFLNHINEYYTKLRKARGFAKGGNVEPDKDEMLAHLMLHKTPDSVNIKDVGVDEAPDLPIKAFVSPNGGGSEGLPIGGVDFQPLTPGNQLMPMQAGQQPGQSPAMPGQSPAPAGQSPAPPPRPGAPQSNILSLTRPGQAMQALRPNPQAMPQQPGPTMPKMAKGGTVEEMRKAIAGAAKSSGMKAPVVANRDLTTMQDSYESLNDRVRKGAMDMQDMIESMPFKYEPGQHVFTAHSARTNLPPFQIVRKTLHGNNPVREDHPKLGPGMGKPIKDPATGKTKRTPYEPGYHVRREVNGEPQEYHIPESAILGHLKEGGPISMEDMRKALGKPDVGGTAHMAGGGRTPKMPWERYTQPKKETEMRTREINPVAGAIKSGADYASNLLDKGPSIRNVLGNVVEAVPFVGPDLRKRMEASNISIPMDVNLASNMPAKDYQYGQPMQYRKPGISTASVPTKDVLDALKMSDLTGTAGLSRAAESAGYGRTPDISDMLDTLGLAAAGYGVTKTGIKGGRAAVGALGDLAKSETGYNLAQKMLELTPGAQPSYIMMGPYSRTWNQKSFEDAVNLAGSKGSLMSPEEIWKRTGNIPNARDFVPRQEINDSNAKFYTPAKLKQKLAEAKEELEWAKQQPLLPKWSTLPDEHRNNFLVYADKLNTVVKDLSEDPEIGIKAKYVLDHPELYAAYPELGEILISQTGQSNPNLKGGFNAKRPEIRIYPQADPRGTAIHEMQHAVQEIEGMSPGTSPSRYGEDLANYLKFHKAVTDAYPNLDPDEAAKNAMYGWYMSHMGEAEARQATKRMNMSPEERLNNFPNYDIEPDWLISKPAEVPDININPTLQYERPASYAKGGRIKPIGYTKERVTVSPNLDAMNYELMSVKHYTKKAK